MTELSTPEWSHVYTITQLKFFSLTLALHRRFGTENFQLWVRLTSHDMQEILKLNRPWYVANTRLLVEKEALCLRSRHSYLYSSHPDSSLINRLFLLITYCLVDSTIRIWVIISLLIILQTVEILLNISHSFLHPFLFSALPLSFIQYIIAYSFEQHMTHFVNVPGDWKELKHFCKNCIDTLLSI